MKHEACIRRVANKVDIDPKKLKRIVREERIDSFVKKHCVRNHMRSLFEESFAYDDEWSEEELFAYTNEDGIMFQIKSVK